MSSANAIRNKLLARFEPLTASGIVQGADDADIAACGLSGPNIRTLRALSEAIVSGNPAL